MKRLPSVFVRVLLSFALFPTGNLSVVEAVDGTIYIRADGRTDPPTANVTSSDNVTYAFTGNNYLPIVDERNNVVLDGSGVLPCKVRAPAPASIGTGSITSRFNA